MCSAWLKGRAHSVSQSFGLRIACGTFLKIRSSISSDTVGAPSHTSGEAKSSIQVPRREPRHDRVKADATSACLCTARQIPQPVSQASVARTCPFHGNSRGLAKDTMRPAGAWSSASTVGCKGTNGSPTLPLKHIRSARPRQSLASHQTAEHGVANHGLHLAATRQGQERSTNLPKPTTRDPRMLPLPVKHGPSAPRP